jgi:hypothetical protein
MAAVRCASALSLDERVRNRAKQYKYKSRQMSEGPELFPSDAAIYEGFASVSIMS